MGGHNRTCPSLRWEGLGDDKFMRETCVTGGKGETGRRMMVRGPKFEVSETSNLVSRLSR